MSEDITRSLKNYAIESNFSKSTLNSKGETEVIQSPLIEISPCDIAKLINLLYDRAETAVRLACYEDADRLADRADEFCHNFEQMKRRKYGLIRRDSASRAEKPAKEEKQMPLPEYFWPANCANIRNIMKYISVFNGR